ncbi:D-alanyl-D-alanine carboxypeptidase family protein [Candidatus Saccharibacteria bacterium]|nr:D-alanyl-D-alanine carboxypeptidase family protein [Candidatus Saccharibacteria bacterium]
MSTTKEKPTSTQMATAIVLFFLFVALAIVVVLATYLGRSPDEIHLSPFKAATVDEDFFVSAMDNRRNYLAVYNENHPYRFGSHYNQDLEEDLIYVADDYTGDLTRVEKAAFYAFSKMKYDLEKQGVKIGLFSAHLNKEEQQAVYDYYSNLEDWKETNKAMKPGFSENHTGLMLNILIWYSEDGENYAWYTETAERQAKIPYFKQVHGILADYGFIDRYPAGKEDITGMPNEPYLIRFVGSTRVAHEIMDNHLCLEEYNDIVKQ